VEHRRLLRAAAHLRHLHAHRTDPGEHFALGQVPIAHHRRAAVPIVPIRVDGQKFLQFRLDRLAQQPLRPITQQLRQRIVHRTWIPKSNDRMLTHGVPTPNAES
jgi:hypothetical protein